MAIDAPKKGPDYDTNVNQEKDPDDWITGGEPMTDAQASYLRTLSRVAGEEFDPDLTKAEAFRRIEELRELTDAGLLLRWRTQVR